MNMPANKRFFLPAICLVALAFFFLRPFLHSYSNSPVSESSAPEYGLESHADTKARPSLQQPVSPKVDASPASKCSVMKLSMLYGAHRFPQLVDAVDSHRRHSSRWGCDFDNLEFELTDRRHFSKQYLILSHILRQLAKPVDQRTEWMMWVDADSIVVNPAISPEAFLPPTHLKNVYALFTADHNGLNDGLFYIRVHYSSVDLLTQVIDYNFAHPDEELGWLGEQVAMQRVVDKVESAARKASKPSGLAWLPRQWFNTYQFERGFEGKPGHHIVHFAGLAETRISHMANWLNELKSNQAKWEIPPEDTFYHTEIPDFWEEYAANLTKTGT